MSEKKKVRKEKIENNKVDLKEILGNIKNVVSEEKETLFKVDEYKTINLKKENLVFAATKKQSDKLIEPNSKEFDSLVRKIVRSELKNFQLKDKLASSKSEKIDSVRGGRGSSSFDLLTKAELISLSKKNKLGLNNKNTKAEIIKELKEKKIKVP